MSEDFCVEPYTIDVFCKLLAESSEVDERAVRNKKHIRYFEGYFGALKTKTIVVEWKYVDRDYLEDFSGYYVRCFKEYPRKCRRFHFFSNEFRRSDLEELLTGDSANLSYDLLKEAYIGFIVVKPLPQTIFGRTCLKTYPDDGGRRSFPILLDCRANLFGLPLTVRSLPFQEQDSVVAACATSALWSAFHGTAGLFHHSVPSPVEITKSGTQAGTGDAQLIERALPNHGLTPYQMAQAVSRIGLEPILCATDSEYLLKSALYAFSRGGFPGVLLLQLYEVVDETPRFMGGHAVAIAGYSLGLREPTLNENGGLLLEACGIDKIYVHDDQVGPFARMVFDQKPLLWKDGTEFPFSMATSWSSGKDGSIDSIRAVPQAILIPLYHKIRIPYQMVEDVLSRFDAFVESLRSEGIAPIQERIKWDIYLTSVNDLKVDVQKSKEVCHGAKLDFLTANMPHYIWRARASSGGNGIIDLFFDATDIEQGGFLAQVIEIDEDFGHLMRLLVNDPRLETVLHGSLAWKILSWFKTPNEK